MSDKTIFQLWCIPNTGSTWVKNLMETNFDTDFSLGNKHGWPKEKNLADEYIITVKNPYSWLASIKRFSATELNEKNIPLFINNIWIKNHRVLIDFNKQHENCHIFRYEDIWNNFEQFIVLASNSYGLDYPDNPTNDVMGNNTDGTEFDPQYYREKKFYSDTHRWHPQIQSLLQKDDAQYVLNELGYDANVPEEYS